MSTATVSRALSTPKRVSEDKRQRIAEAIAATGYTLNQSARSLRLKEARTILVAMPNIGNPYYSTIVDSVLGTAAARGYGVLVVNRVPERQETWLRDYFLSNRADGLLLFDANVDLESLSGLPLNHGRLPLVCVSDEIVGRHYNLVTADNAEASKRAVEYLISLGHRRIGHVQGRFVRNYRNERFAGFCEAMQAAGLEIVPDWLFRGEHNTRGGLDAAEGFIALAERPTAMFCANDESAVGFLFGLRRHGLVCPEDVSVIGFDDVALCSHYAPPLTTMRQPRAEMGARAAEHLIDIIEGRAGGPPLREVLTCELVIRESTAPPLLVRQRRPAIATAGL